MLTDFTDKTGAALVVGATGGIGAAIARMLAHRGSRVALTYRTNSLQSHDICRSLCPGTCVA